MTDDLHHFIDGAAIGGGSGRFAPIFDPAAGAVRARLPLANAAEVDAAVMAAARALPAWAATPPLARARILFRFKQALEREADALAAVISGEHGKVLSDARGSLQRGIEVVEFACGIPHLLKGEFSAGVGADMDCFSLRQPVGVCAGITPFNFPAMVPMWMFPVAIACGNTFVLKPSEKVPSCSLRLAELLAEAGLPPGVLNVLGGDAEAVDALLRHPQVRAISFVGSTPVARQIYATAAAAGKRVQALAGAKNHLVVLPDADLNQTIEALMGAAYGSAGERCMAVPVAVAVGDVAEPLVERLAARVRALKIGPATDPQAEMGPLISAEHRAKVAGYVDLGVGEGAELVVDGRGLSLQGWEGGFFLGGSLFDRVTPSMRIYQEEIFGPVLGVVRTRDPRRGTGAHRRQPLRQRGCHLHPFRRRCPRLRRPGAGGNGRCQRGDPGAARLPQLRRLEAVAVRRSRDAWAGRGALLHPAENRHCPLAGERRSRQFRRLRHADFRLRPPPRRWPR